MLTYKKILPQDVYTSINPIIEIKETENGIKKIEKCPNKPSGVEFMDAFAWLLWHRPFADNKYYASKLQVDETAFSHTIMVLSGISAKEWRDYYVKTAAYELLEHSELNIKDIAHRLGFTSLSVFSRYFEKNTGIRPLIWRFRARGFNVSKDAIRKLRMLKAGIDYNV